MRALKALGDTKAFSTFGSKCTPCFGLGASLPMRKGRSLLTLSVNYSSLGSKDLLQRNVLTFGIAVSSCERWFVKRKYN